MNPFELIHYDSLDFHEIDLDQTSPFCQIPCKHSREDEKSYLPGTEEYKKARKRRQNRESAVKIRARKKIEDCQVFASLKSLKENTGKLKVENAHLQSENEVLKKQLSLYKQLVGVGEEGKSMKNDGTEIEKKKIGKGKNVAGVALALTLLCLICVFRIDDTQPINTGGRSLVFSESSYSAKPVMIAGLIMATMTLLRYLFS